MVTRMSTALVNDSVPEIEIDDGETVIKMKFVRDTGSALKIESERCGFSGPTTKGETVRAVI